MQTPNEKCDYPGCSFSFTDTESLSKHKEVSHPLHQKFQCLLCGKVLSSKQNYKDHSNIHTGEKPYKCHHPGCNQSFRQLSQFYTHNKLHTHVETLSNSKESHILIVLSKNLSYLSTAPITDKNSYFSPVILPKLIDSIPDFQPPLPSFLSISENNILKDSY